MAKRYFELVSTTSAKFWEVWTKGATVWTRFGPIGSDGSESSRVEASEQAARATVAKIVREKTAKGYVPSSRPGAPRKSAARTTKTVAKRTAKGATRTTTAAAKATTKAAAVPVSAFDAQIARIEKKAARAGVVLPDGASEEQIAEAERRLGRTLPAEVRAYYRRHDGAGEFMNSYVVAGRELLSLANIVKQWKVWRGLLEEGTFVDSDEIVRPDPGVQQRWWIWEWVPVTYDGAGNHHVLDLAPARGGTYGQVLSFWHDDGPRTVEGKSFLGWLEKVEWGEH